MPSFKFCEVLRRILRTKQDGSGSSEAMEGSGRWQDRSRYKREKLAGLACLLLLVCRWMWRRKCGGPGRGVGEGTEMGSRGVSIMARARPKMKGAAPSKEGRTKTWWPLGQVRPHGHGRLPRSPPPVRSHPGFGDRLEHHRPLTPGLRPLGQRRRLPGPPLPPRRPGSRPFPRLAEPRCSSAPRPALFPAAPASLLPIARLSASTAATPERPRLAPLTFSQQPLPR